MKKRCIVTLLVLIIASSSIFAVKDTFDVTTTIGEIGLMKVSESAIRKSTAQGYADTGLFGDLTVKSSGTQNFTAYLTTLSNKRTGFEVTMEATPMTSTIVSNTSHINYTVSCNGRSVTTTMASDNAPVSVVKVESLHRLTGSSHAIALSVDGPTFDTAVSGSYTGKVTFTYKAK